VVDGESSGGVGYRLILSFPDQSSSFAFGFHAGQIWAEMKRNTSAELTFDTATENREVIQRMAEHLGWSIDVKPSEIDGWDTTILTKVTGEGRRINPHGLRIVSQL